MSESITISPQRMIETIIMDVTVEEAGIDELTITQHPVETNASITDHAYKNPATLTIRAGSSNSGEQSGGDEGYVTALYARLLALQVSRVPFDVVTGKRRYSNMLFRSLGVTTDQASEAALMLSASFQEIIIVSTQTSTLPPTANQAVPQKTGATSNQGAVQPIPATPGAGAGP